MSSTDHRMEHAQTSLEQQNQEVVAAKNALRTAVEEHNMMAQEYYATMERFSQLHEELDYAQANNQLVLADCETLETELEQQGGEARQRLYQLSKERDTLQCVLEQRTQENRKECTESIQSANEILLKQTDELVLTKAKLSMAQKEIDQVTSRERTAAQRAEHLFSKTKTLQGHVELQEQGRAAADI